MGTRKAWNVLGDAHALTFCTYRRTNVFRDTLCCELFLQSLIDAKHRLNFLVRGYVLMPNHVHLVVTPCDEAHDMGQILKGIKHPATHSIMRYLRECRPAAAERLTWERSDGKVLSRLWQAGGGYDKNLTSREELRHALEYLHMNPVRRELCVNAEEYRFSSARAYFENAPDRMVDLLDD